MSDRGRDLYASNPELVAFSRTGSVTSEVDRRPAVSRTARSLLFPGLIGSASVISSVPAATLNRRGRSVAVTQQTVGGTNTLLPLVYGQARVGGKIFAIKVNSSRSLVCGVAWCHGEVDSVVSVQINDASVPSGVTVTSYTGTSGQTANATLAGAISGYADDLPGVCYSVFVIPSGKISGFPRFNAVIKGQKVSATSGGAKAWSDNPAYCLADFIESTTYGMGKTVDWTTVATVAAACDALVGSPSEKKRLLNLALDTTALGVEWLEVLRDYAGCYVYHDGAGYRLVADATGSSVYSFTASNIIAGSMRIEKRPLAQQPTMVEVVYTDTSVTPWREARYCTAPASPRIFSRIAKPGITRYSEAVRYATERLNEATLCDLSATWQTDDAALALQGGELVDVTHPIGLTAKVLRIDQPRQVSPGRWEIHGIEYDAAKYSTSVATAPTTPDTSLPSPVDPTLAVSSLHTANNFVQGITGTWSQVIDAYWDPATPASPYLIGYDVIVTITSGGAFFDQAFVTDRFYRSPPVAYGVEYTVSVRPLTSVGFYGAAVSDTYTVTALPGGPANAASVSADVSVPGTVKLSWPASSDVSVAGYEIRYGGTTWETATSLAVVPAPATSYETTALPAGSTTFRLKALNGVRTSTYPIGEEAATAVSTTATVKALTAIDEIEGSLDLSGVSVVISADWSNGTLGNRLVYRTRTTDGATGMLATPNGAGTASSWTLTNASSLSNYAGVQFGISGSTAYVGSVNAGSGTLLPLGFYVGGTQYANFDTSGRWHWKFSSKSGLPTTSDIAAGYAGVWKDTGTGTGTVYLAVNDGGTIKKVALA